MKTLFIETRKKFDESKIDFSALDEIPGKSVSVGATIQYLGLIPVVKRYLEDKGKKVFVKRGPRYSGHVIGCNSSAFDLDADSFLLITDGKFHALNNAIQLDREIYVFDGNVIEKVSKNDIEDQKKRTTAKKKLFLSSEKVGLILSLKSGQRNNAVKTIKKKIEKTGKIVYVFEGDVISANEFENFPQIKIWVNTACFGLALDDKRIINLSDILEYIE
jgi:2-(3-amino-3-carboxypropyl)histidine synthase